MRQLLAIRATGSLARAAQTLGVSQPNLSASVARLEDQLKIKLLERSAAGSQLTPIGELIAERASKVIRETEQIVRDAALVAGGGAGILRLGFGSALTEPFMGRLVRRLVDAYPTLDISTVVLDRSQLVPLLKDGELDLVICSYGDDLLAENLVATQVLTAHAVAAAHPDHELVGEPEVSIERFSEFPSVGAQNVLANSSILGTSSAQPLVARYQCNAYAPMLDLVLSGVATLIAPDFVVGPHVEAGRLKRIDLQHEFRLSFVAVSARAGSYSPIICRAVEYATDLGAEVQRQTGHSLERAVRAPGTL